MEKKFTQKEFIERHVEFLKNYSTKYRFQDLDFRSVMGMSGCDDDEFRELPRAQPSLPIANEVYT